MSQVIALHSRACTEEVAEAQAVLHLLIAHSSW